MTLDQVWSDIRAKIGNRSASPPFGRFPEIVLTKPQKSHLDRSFCWLIGPFLAVREIAEFLRSEKGLQDELTVLNVRIGRRETDLPPQGQRIQRIGDKGEANTTDRTQTIDLRKVPGKLMPRVSDLYDPVRKYWAARSLEAHHIVEKGMLADLHLNKRDLNNDRAPTVLLSAEFHQRLFTSEVARERGKFKTKLQGAQAYELLKGIYDELYNDPVLISLKEIADIINSAVKDNL